MSDDALVDDALIDVRIDRLATGGDAVGRQQGEAGGAGDAGDATDVNDGRAVFVALAAPGERVIARVYRRKKRVAWAELVDVRQPSDVRVAPPCPLFGRCGGCQWQHVNLEAQRAAKRAIVARALGLPDVELVVPVEGGQGYRDRARFVVGAGGEIGFRARRSHTVVDVDRCLLLSPALDTALGGLRASAVSLPAGTEVDLLAGREGVHVALRLPPFIAVAASEALDAVDGATLFVALKGVGVVGLRVSRAGRTRPSTVASFGAVDVDIAALGEAPLRVPAGAFAQVGRAGNAALLRIVLEEIGQGPGVLLELHAGSGNFTRHMGRALRVVACDADADAITRGRHNAPQATWLRRPPSAVDLVPDTVLVDPPREGLDTENFAAAARARRRLVYVSCDPQTLGRDAANLAKAGLVLRRAVALDLMPHTFHVEVVAVFECA